MDTETWMDIGYVVGLISGALMLTWFGWVPLFIVMAWVGYKAYRRETGD